MSRRELISLVEDVAEEAGVRAARRALQEVGISADEAKRDELMADLSHLRRCRRAFDKGVMTIGNAVVLAIVGGLLTVMWVGFKLHVLKEPP